MLIQSRVPVTKILHLDAYKFAPALNFSHLDFVDVDLKWSENSHVA